MKKIFLILITFFSNNYYISGAGAASAVSRAVSNTVNTATTVVEGVIAVTTGNTAILECQFGNSIDDYIGCISQALIPGSTGSAAVNNITSITPPATPGSTPSTCYYDIKGTNPFFKSNGTACKTPAPQCCYENPKPAGCTGCTMDCLLASANSALAAEVLPILGLTVVANKIGRIYPVEVDVFLNAGSGNYTSSVLTNSACVASGNGCQCPNSSGPFNAGNMSGLLTGNSCGTLAPFYTYISNCLNEGKIDTPSTGYGRAYNNKVFFNNAGATFNGQTVNPIQCMACTNGTISSCTVFNDGNNPYPACAAQTTGIAPVAPQEEGGPEMPPQYYTEDCVGCD